jgi:hypothetical protein
MIVRRIAYILIGAWLAWGAMAYMDEHPQDCYSTSGRDVVCYDR